MDHPFFHYIYDSIFIFLGKKSRVLNVKIFSQDNPGRANGHIFNVGNPNNEVTIRQLAEMMTELNKALVYLMQYQSYFFPYGILYIDDFLHSILQVYAKGSGEPPLEAPTVDVSSKEFYGEGYDDSDKRIPDMTIINKQLGNNLFPNFLHYHAVLLRLG